MIINTAIKEEAKFISKSFLKKTEAPVNEGIPFDEVMVISESGEQLGTMDRSAAIKLAEDRNFDLVCVAPQAKVPVCKFMDYSKYRYEQIKRAKEAQKNQKNIVIKEVRLNPTIDVHDYETKMRNATRFLKAGDKVKVTCRFRGRMIDRSQKALEMFKQFGASLEEIAVIEREPILDGRNLTMIIGPKTDKNK